MHTFSVFLFHLISSLGLALCAVYCVFRSLGVRSRLLCYQSERLRKATKLATMLSHLLTQLCLLATATALALPQSANYDTATSAGGGSAVNSDAGASGSTAGFTLSTGGLVAIIIVVIAAVIFGGKR